MGFPGGSDDKESACNAGDLGLISESRRSPGKGNGNPLQYSLCLPGGSDSKEFASKAGNLGLIPGLGRFPGGGHGNLLQYSCLENSMDRGAWRATVCGVAKSQT